jgi:hypothetical protein
MAKREVNVVKMQNINSSRWLNQWYVDASPTPKNSKPDPYVVSQPKVGDMWECGCKSWVSNHPREDCKHIMRVKLTATPMASEIKVEPSMQFIQATGRVFRD